MVDFHPSVCPLTPVSDLSYLFSFFNGSLLLAESDEFDLRPEPMTQDAAGVADRQYLGRLGEHDCWTQRVDEIPAGFRAMPLRAAMMALPPALMALAGRAAQIVEWDRAHRYCGACGTEAERRAAERVRVCPACGQHAYPRISPAMMALVWRDGEILLARSPHFSTGYYSVLAGFVEAGESVEECVAREVAEEVGVCVDEITYYGSQSWPFPHSLMLAFSARWVGGEIVPQPCEIEHAAWFKLNELPPIPPLFSISGHLIRDAVAALQQGNCPGTQRVI